MKITKLRIEGTFHGEHLGGDDWRLDQPIGYYWSEDGEEHTVTVPEGYKTDRLSMPKRLRGIFQKDGRSNLPSILHDYMYGTHSVSRKHADKLLLAFMRYKGVKWHRMWIMYGFLRAFGWAAYRRD